MSEAGFWRDLAAQVGSIHPDEAGDSIGDILSVVESMHEALLRIIAHQQSVTEGDGWTSPEGKPPAKQFVLVKYDDGLVCSGFWAGYDEKWHSEAVRYDKRHKVIGWKALTDD